MKLAMAMMVTAGALAAFGTEYTFKSDVNDKDIDWSLGSNYVGDPATGPQKDDKIIIPEGVTVRVSPEAAALNGLCGTCDIVVEAGGTLSILTNPVERAAKTYVKTLTGSGTVMNPNAQKLQELHICKSCTFDGKISGKTHTFVLERATFTMTDADQTMSGSPILKDYARIRYSLFNKGGHKAWGGGSFNMNEKSAVEYIGAEDVTSGQVLDAAVWNGNYFVIDAGAWGGFTYNGKIGSSAPQWNVLLTGDNAYDTIYRAYKDSSATLKGPIAIRKEGSGTWYMKQTAQTGRPTSTIEVADGTLKYDTIAPLGSECSLGIQDQLYKFNTRSLTSATPVDYALLLGGTDSKGVATVGMLQSAAVTDGIKNYDRKIVIESKGGFRSGRSRLMIDGVTAASAGAKTLVLEGDVSNNDILSNLSDGPGTLSVEKRGAGTWTLRDPTQISGKIDVQNGRLEILNGAGTKYTWYRLTVKATGFWDDRQYLNTGKTFREYSLEEWQKGKGAAATTGDQRILACHELFLFDAEGKRHGVYPLQHVDKAIAGNEYTLAQQSTNAFPSICQPGHFSCDAPSLVTTSTRSLSGMFEAGTHTKGVDPSDPNFHYNDWLASGMGRNLDPNDESTWVHVVFRLAENDDAAPLAYFDFLHSYAKDTQHVGKDITRCAIEGSADGMNWEVLRTVDMTDFVSSAGGTASGASLSLSGMSTTAEQLAKTFAFTKTAPTAPAAMTLSSPVSVAPGAELVCNGAVSISKLEMGASGFGSVSGDAALAAAGTITVDPLPSGQRSKTFTTGLKDVSGAANLANWKVNAGGASNCYDLSYNADTGAITVSRRPLKVLFK